MRKIVALSIDYDGCIAPINGQPNLIESTIIARILHMLSTGEADEVRIMIGSSRQFLHLDQQNALLNNNGSCYVFFDHMIYEFKKKYPELANKIIFDPYILEDVARNKTPGFCASVFLETQEYGRAEWLDDIDFDDINTMYKDKCFMVGAQLHHLRRLYPTDSVTYHFFDDNHNILKNLERQYSRSVDQIPHDLRFNGELVNAQDNTITRVFNLTGTGEIMGEVYREAVATFKSHFRKLGDDKNTTNWSPLNAYHEIEQNELPNTAEQPKNEIIFPEAVAPSHDKSFLFDFLDKKLNDFKNKLSQSKVKTDEEKNWLVMGHEGYLQLKCILQNATLDSPDDFSQLIERWARAKNPLIPTKQNLDVLYQMDAAEYQHTFFCFQRQYEMRDLRQWVDAVTMKLSHSPLRGVGV